eukprot:gene24715-10353_t
MLSTKLDLAKLALLVLAFATVLVGRAASAAKVSSPVDSGAADWDILDFTGGLEAMDGPRWGRTDDGVMGGLSQSSMAWDASEKAAVFSGNVTTANNGGFASVRFGPWDGFGALGPARGVRLAVKGDGQIYKLTLKEDDGYDGVNFQQDFQTSAGAWTNVDLLLRDLKPNFRGEMVEGRPPVDGYKVRQVGIMLSKFSDTGGLTEGFKAGPFRLYLRSIRAFQ